MHLKYFELMIPVSLLGIGKCFGELALEFDPKNPTKKIKRQASILCTEDCQFAIISKKDYISIFQILDQRRREMQLRFFR